MAKFITIKKLETYDSVKTTNVYVNIDMIISIELIDGIYIINMPENITIHTKELHEAIRNSIE